LTEITAKVRQPNPDPRPPREGDSYRVTNDFGKVAVWHRLWRTETFSAIGAHPQRSAVRQTRRLSQTEVTIGARS